MTLTEAGVALLDQSAEQLGGLDHALDYVGSLGDVPRGVLTITTGIGFGVNVLSELLPEFMRRYPYVDAVLDLSSQPADLVSERVDVAIRMGALPDSQIVARKLGVLNRYCCASPEYLALRGTPVEIEDLRAHDLVDLPIRDGRKYVWSFERDGVRVEHRQTARLTVNCALTLHRMLLNGAGVGLSSGYLCAPEIEAGRLVRLFPEWKLPSVPVHAIFPSRRELAPKVRAFVEFMTKHSRDGCHWQRDSLSARIITDANVSDKFSQS